MPPQDGVCEKDLIYRRLLALFIILGYKIFILFDPDVYRMEIKETSNGWR
jgi:hypothetical protein